MGDRTGISWTDATWNPIRGCSRVSEGCRHCYAEKVAARFSGPGQPYDGLARRGEERDAGPYGPRWTGEVRMVPEMLDQPLRWRKPRRIFVNSMSDLFHEKLTDEQIAAVFGVMAAAPQHTFQVLTKRPERMRAWFEWFAAQGPWRAALRWFGWLVRSDWTPAGSSAGRVDESRVIPSSQPWPLPNVWLGVSVENQQTADERIPLLLVTPAAVRFVSAEPLLGPLNLREMAHRDDWHVDALDTPDPSCRLHWIIVGGESGPGARPCDVAWIRSIVEQCRDAGVACFVKQLGARPTVCGYSPTDKTLNDAHPDVRLLQTIRRPKGDDPTEWPENLRVQQFPLPVNATTEAA